MNYSTTIEHSATYQMLISMGFSSDICKSAAKIYLNDIEDAVTYCCNSESSSPCSIDNNCNNQGINFKKCYDLLQTSYPQFLHLFINWFKQEEFEDEQLIEEFVENNDYSQSFFIQYIEDMVDSCYNISFDETTANLLFSDLSRAITNAPMSNRSQSIDYSQLIDAYIRQNITNVLQTKFVPRKLSVLCYDYYPKFNDNIINIDMNSCNNKYLINETKLLFQCTCFKLYNSLCPKELCSLLIIGQNNNNFPLLTYLIDSYNRYKIQICTKFNLLGKINSYKSANKLQLDDISIAEFITNKCIIFNDYPSFQNMCIKSMEYLTSISALGKMTLGRQSRYRINDSVTDCTSYICDMYKFISTYLNNLPYSSMPCQFDLIIIPKSVIDTDTNQSGSFDCNIHNLLSNSNVPYVQLKTLAEFSDPSEMLKLTQKLIKNKKNQRLCVLIVRGDFDKIYIYQMKDKINTKQQQFINESIFNNSINCLIPNLCGCNEIENVNGCLFSLSFHIISKYKVRVYLNIDNVITRFFISDLRAYLPTYFETNDFNNSQHIQQTIRNIRSVQNILSDSIFDQFYKLILMDDKESSHYYI